MRDRVVNLFMEESQLLDERALAFIASQEDPVGASRRVLESVRCLDPPPLVLSMTDVRECLEVPIERLGGAVMLLDPSCETTQVALSEGLGGGRMVARPAPETTVGPGKQAGPPVPITTPAPIGSPSPPGSVMARSPVSDLVEECSVEILQDITSNSTCTGCIGDFVRYFQDRFKRLKRLLVNRREMLGAAPIASIPNRGGVVKSIGMVLDCQKTNRGGVIFKLEDESGSIKVLSSPGRDTPLDILTDEVVGVVGTLNPSKKLVYADQVIRPEVPVRRRGHRTDRDLAVAFASDIHVGSNTFLDTQWNQFMDFLNGRMDSTNGILDILEYLVIPGDVVDGIGVYPNQRQELLIPDIYRQYEALAELLKEVPDHIEVLIQPGNHDAVRLAEPQPALPGDITKMFAGKVRFLGNPTLINIEGVNILSYHGKSIDDFVTHVQRCTYEDPILAMKEMLKRRHLAPVYGSRTSIAPEATDHLVIETIPDIFVTGHVHGAGVEPYRGSLLINASAWQSQTNYQRTMNFVPDPAKVPIVNLRDLSVKLLDFAS